MAKNLSKNQSKGALAKQRQYGGFQNKAQQQEWEEAMELDRILEEERR